MKIWLISIFEQTPVDKVFSTRFIDIADMAVARGHDVTFFASTFKHNTKNQRYTDNTSVPVNEKYQLEFIKSLGYKKNISLKRLYSHYAFSKNLISHLKKKERPEVIFMAYPSISIAYEVTKWAEKEKIPVIVDIIDPWPDIFRKSMKSMPEKIQDVILFPMASKLKFIFKRAAAVTAISNQYIDWARGYYPNITSTNCFYPSVQYREMKQEFAEIATTTKKDNSVFRVIYAGSLASSYDIATILKAAAILNNKYGNKIEFSIAGTGPQQVLINEYLGKISNLKYLGRLTKKDLLKEYFVADIGLTQHIKGATQSVTYKLFDLLACGLPIMNSLESEMNNIILDNKVGLFNAPGDAVTLADNIEYCYKNEAVMSQMKKSAHELTARLGDSEIVYGNVLNFIEQTAVKATK